MLVISILYNGEIEGFECGFPCFLPDYDAIFHALKIAKWIVLFLFLYNLGRFTRPQSPISLPSTPQNSTSAPLFRCPERHFLIPQTTIWDVPFYHLGYPILPFGVSHFAIWGIYSAHLRTMYSPIFGLSSSFFAAKVCMFSFLSVHYVSSEFIWLDKIYFITLPILLLLPWQDTKNTDMT